MREPMVTRSIKSFIADCTVVNKENGDTYRKEIITTKNSDKERNKSLADNEQLCFTHSVSESVKLYGVSVTKFMEIAEELPERAAKESE